MFHFILFFAFGSAIPNLLRCCFCIVSAVASLLFLAGCYPVGCILVREMAMVTAISKTSMEILFSSPISIIWSGDIPTTVVVRVRGFRSQSNLHFGENACAYTHTHTYTHNSIFIYYYYYCIFHFHRNIHHPNVVMLMGTCTGPLQKDMFLVLVPLQIAGSLHSILHVEHDKLSIMDTVCIIKDIVNGIMNVHAGCYYYWS